MNNPNPSGHVVFGSLVLSVGLNVGPVEPAHQLSRTIERVERLLSARVLSVAVTQPKGPGVHERFVQLHVLPLLALHKVPRALTGLASSLGQASVSQLRGNNSDWLLHFADGRVCQVGGTVQDHPVVLPGRETAAA